MTVVEAARDLGAGPFLAFRRVFFPLVAPAIMGSVLLALATSLDELIISLFVNGRAYTVPVFIFAQDAVRSVDVGQRDRESSCSRSPWGFRLAARYVSVRDVR